MTQPEEPKRVRVLLTLTVELDYSEWEITTNHGSKPALFASAFPEHGISGFETAFVLPGAIASHPTEVPTDEF